VYRVPPVTPSPKKRGPPKFVQPDTDSDSPSPSPSKKRKISGTSASATTTPSSSPRKRGKSGAGTPSPKKKPKPPVQPENMWRKSDIPKDLTITKGNAQKLFRVCVVSQGRERQLMCTYLVNCGRLGCFWDILYGER
jgi:hypothetical protein